jgi:hypothetical protein
MAVDLGIGTVQTTLTATDPELFKSPGFRAQVMAIVREELARDQELKKRRENDTRGSSKAG